MSNIIRRSYSIAPNSVWAAISCAVVLAVAAMEMTAPARAQQAPEAPGGANAPKASDLAKKAYEAGVKAFQAGKHQPAVDSLSAALRGGGLASAEMARALYIRGLAYKKLNKPGLAISDLTSALWLKNGLNDADRKSATAERAEAYKSAGLGDGNTGSDQVAVADPNTAQPAAAAKNAESPASAQPAGQAAAAHVPAPAPQPQSTDASPAPAPAGSSTATAPAEGVPQPLTIGGSVAPPPTRTAPSTVTAAPSQTAAAAPEGGSGIGSFFSNLFSSSEPQPVAPPVDAPATTASTTQPPPATSSWTSDNGAAPAGAQGAPAKAMKQAAIQENAKTAAPAIPAAAPAVVEKPVPVKTGKYKAHIAAFRTRAEAEALAQKLSQQHGTTFVSHAPVVDEAVIGSMGTFYRVRIGGYASADEPRGLCNTLRNSGYDCLVVSN